MTYKAQIFVDPARQLGRIDPLIYGQFIEQVGRVIYGGVFEPGSKLSDKNGFRKDVLEAARGLSPTVIRWPGGNFASRYRWSDGVGNDRPRRGDVGQNSVDDNSFGTEEFLQYCRILETEPYLRVNMGTGALDEALQWLEYCNGSETDIPAVAQRTKGPHPRPHNVKYWGLGDADGSPGHSHGSAQDYGARAREWAKLMRQTDDSIKLIAAGTSDPDWNWTLLKSAAPYIDYVSLHFHWKANGDPYESILAGPSGSEDMIVATHGMALAARRHLALTKPIAIAVDEWGITSHTSIPGNSSQLSPTEEGFSAGSEIDTSLERPYDLKDALAVASWLHLMWRHPEKIKLATQAQMVSAIAPIQTTPDGIVKHTIWWPMAVARAEAGTHSLDVLTRTETTVNAPGTAENELPAVDAAATYDPETKKVHISLVNRSRIEECDARIRLGRKHGEMESITLWHEDPFAGNTPENPQMVTAKKISLGTPRRMHFLLKPHSHTTITFTHG